MRRSFTHVWMNVAMLIIVIVAFFAPLMARAEMTHTFVGLSPSTVQETSLLRDRPVKKTVHLQRDLDTLPLTLEVTYAGEDGRFLRGPATVEFPVGVKQTLFTFEIMPEGAATGSYNALVNFLPDLVPDEVGGTGFGIRRGVALKVAFSVTDVEVLEYKVGHVELRQTEEDLPIFFEYEVANTGNVEWRPDEVRLSFTRPLTAEQSGIVTIPGDAFTFAEPGGSTRVEAEAAHELEPGNYDVVIDFIHEGETVHTTVSSMIVFENGTLQQSASIISLVTNKENFRAGENIRVTATMANIGDITTAGILVTEVYSSSGELVDIMTSSQRTVGAGEQTPIDQIVELQIPDTYRIEGYIEYAGSKVTERLSTTIVVENTILGSQDMIIPLILLLAAGILSIIVVVIVVKMLMRRQKARVVPAPPVAGTPPSIAPAPQAPMAPTPSAPVAPAPMLQVPPPVAPPQATPIPAQRPMPEGNIPRQNNAPLTAPPLQQAPPQPAVAPPQNIVVPPPVRQPQTSYQPTPAPAKPVAPTAPQPLPAKPVTPSAAPPAVKKVEEVSRPPVPPDDDELWTISL